MMICCLRNKMLPRRPVRAELETFRQGREKKDSKEDKVAHARERFRAGHEAHDF